MVNVRPIRTEADYEAALARVAELMDSREGTPEGEELDVLADLVEVYEDKHVPMGYPDPVAAIEFCMDQQDLTPRDLVPYIGSRARVSEVLSGKRAITMPMARALHEHLGIPAEVLLQKPAPASDASLDDLDAERFPLKEMAKRGWILEVPDLKQRATELVAGFLSRAGGSDALEAVPMYRKNDHQRINAKADPYALRAWCWQVLASANEDPPSVPYERTVNPDFLREVAQLSVAEDGPVRARDYLADHGIALRVERHLPRTHLDGAVFRLPGKAPVIGLTLRYDRIDNFWFCLLHELAHLGRHLDGRPEGFVDDFDLPGNSAREAEADEWAQEALIPREEWVRSAIWLEPAALNVIYLANTLHIHPAIVAGRLRYESGNYRLLSQLVGTGKVRQQFEEA
ncbi:MAG: ImmA/IrrE family metallo-endopeptidase [Chloroflexi bacterium]|nr:ImmA/IrrE family metallo-endopeptidase [Chloroflexota bacterium]